MSDGTTRASLVGPHSDDWEVSPSRPSKDNRTDPENGSQSASPGCGWESYQQAAREYVDEHVDGLGPIACRPLFVTGGRKLRRDAVRERRDKPGTYRAKTAAEVVQNYLAWFLEQEDLVLNFGDFTSPVGSSYNEAATRRNYGKLCDLERGSYQVARNGGDGLWTVLMGLTVSHENANSDPRCPVDLERELVEVAWSNHTWQALWHTMSDRHGEVHRLTDVDDLENPPDRWWEYACILEPHKSGQAHMHLAIISNFEIDVETFRPMIEKHVENAPSANWAAHPIDPDTPESSCVTVRGVDLETGSEGEVVGTLVLYLSGYLSQFGEDGEFVNMLDREPKEVLFLATTWVTGTHKIEFSNGGHRLVDLGYQLRPDHYKAGGRYLEVPPPEAVENIRAGESLFFGILLNTGGISFTGSCGLDHINKVSYDDET